MIDCECYAYLAKHGELRFTTYTSILFRLAEYFYVYIYYDRERHILGIEPVKIRGINSYRLSCIMGGKSTRTSVFRLSRHEEDFKKYFSVGRYKLLNYKINGLIYIKSTDFIGE